MAVYVYAQGYRIPPAGPSYILYLYTIMKETSEVEEKPFTSSLNMCPPVRQPYAYSVPSPRRLF